MYFIQSNTLLLCIFNSLINFFRAATAFDIFGTVNAKELLTCGFQYPSLPINDHAPTRQTTGTFFSGRNNDRAPARQTTVSLFFSGRNNDR